MSQYPQGDPVEEARLLLPWYITGKLTEPERRLVEQMLAQHPELHEEYQRELRVVEMIRTNHSLLQLTAVDTTQQRLDKLMKRIGREEQAKVAKSTPQPAPVRRWWQWLQDLLPTTGWLTPASVALAGLLLVQSSVLGWLLYQYQGEGGIVNEMGYTTADVAPDKAAPGTVLLVSFKDNASISQLQAFLGKWNARIIDGPDPNNNNVFRIELRQIPESDLQRSDLILQEMQQDQALIVFIGREF